jgi:hypothetical protein
MKAKIFFITLFTTTTFSFGQKIDFSSDWLMQLEKPNDENELLKPDDFKIEYNAYDFSSLIIPKTEFLGFIGNDYQRINIYFTSVLIDSISNTYTINGISRVNNIKCDFNGKINTIQIREFANLHLGVDQIYKNEGIKAQGLLIGEYSFKENKSQPHSGEFKGIMTLYWYLDRYGILHYDNIEYYSDSYKNNQYIGIWKDYLTGIEKICNFGEHRIQFSGDLDIGAGEFSPNPKYLNRGWKDLELK